MDTHLQITFFIHEVRLQPFIFKASLSGCIRQYKSASSHALYFYYSLDYYVTDPPYIRHNNFPQICFFSATFRVLFFAIASRENIKLGEKIGTR